MNKKVMQSTLSNINHTGPADIGLGYKNFYTGSRIKAVVPGSVYTQVLLSVAHASLHDNLSSSRAQIQRYLKAKYITQQIFVAIPYYAHKTRTNYQTVNSYQPLRTEEIEKLIVRNFINFRYSTSFDKRVSSCLQ